MSDPYQLKEDSGAEPVDLKLTLRDEMMIEYPELIDDNVANELGVAKERIKINNSHCESDNNIQATPQSNQVTFKSDHRLTSCRIVNNADVSNQRPPQSFKIQLTEEQILNHLLSSPHKYSGNLVHRITPEEADVLLKRKWTHSSGSRLLKTPTALAMSEKDYTNLPRAVKCYQRRAAKTTHKAQSTITKVSTATNPLANCNEASSTLRGTINSSNNNTTHPVLPNTRARSDGPIVIQSSNVLSPACWSSLSSPMTQLAILPAPNSDRSAIKKARLALFSQVSRASLNGRNVVIPIRHDSSSETPLPIVSLSPRGPTRVVLTSNNIAPKQQKISESSQHDRSCAQSTQGASFESNSTVLSCLTPVLPVQSVFQDSVDQLPSLETDGTTTATEDGKTSTKKHKQRSRSTCNPIHEKRESQNISQQSHIKHCRDSSTNSTDTTRDTVVGIPLSRPGVPKNTYTRYCFQPKPIENFRICRARPV